MTKSFLGCAPIERTTSQKFVTFGCVGIVIVTILLALPVESEGQDGTLYRVRLAPAPPLRFPLIDKPTYEIFEYACHEGNHGMFNMLSAARAVEAAAGEAQ